MAQVINTNVMSLNSQRALNMSQKSMATSLERLSSGLRINRAADDAAGMAVSETMTSQIRGLGQAVRNANDGISLAQTAEGAASEMHNILQRMNELAVQSLNGTYDDANNRAQIDLEFQELVAELGSITTEAEFNGQAILDGTAFGIQVGDTAGNVITVGGSATDLSTLGIESDDVSTSSAASTALTNIASAIQTVNTARATFGAAQNRLESKVRNLENVIENTSAARSRIRDADFAAETSNLTRTQILQQAGIAMLAQANALPQNALSLLR
jgi:flagellin